MLGAYSFPPGASRTAVLRGRAGASRTFARGAAAEGNRLPRALGANRPAVISLDAAGRSFFSAVVISTHPTTTSPPKGGRRAESHRDGLRTAGRVTDAESPPSALAGSCGSLWRVRVGYSAEVHRSHSPHTSSGLTIGQPHACFHSPSSRR